MQKYYKISKSELNNIIAVLILASLFLRVFRSGQREGLNFWEFLINHSIWGPPVEYVPEENYSVMLDKVIKK